jgi:trimeric autotransporter adhesin
MKIKTNIIYPAIAVFALACFALLPAARAVVPPPDGGYPGQNTAEGQQALLSLTTGVWNTALGFQALKSDTFGNSNTATGGRALFSNTTGIRNTANGAFALSKNTTDSFNTATGFQALFSNTGDGGHNNVATGYQALYNNTTGRRNTAHGSSALYSNTTGNFNVAQGDQALYSNPSGIVNTAIGWGALFSNTNCFDPGCTGGGSGNTAVGAEALISNTAGGGNTAVGEGALINHLTGNQNIVLGLRAGQDLTDGQVNIYIANQGVPSENTTIRIGNVVSWTDIYGFGHPAHTATFIAGISGQTASGGAAVFVNTDGKLGTLTSSARFKTDIKPMDKTSEAILSLKPVTFRYKKEVDTQCIPQFGLVAEDVEKVNPDLVVRDGEGKVYSVRYEAVNAMLLNEFLKEHRKVEKLEATFAQQRKDFEAAVAQLTAQVQKVSAQLEASQPAPQVVNNP